MWRRRRWQRVAHDWRGDRAHAAPHRSVRGPVVVLTERKRCMTRRARCVGETPTSGALVDALCAAAVSIATDRRATSTSVVSESHTTPRTGACEHSSESQRVRRYARHTSYPDFAGRHVVGRRLWLRRRSPTHPRRSSGGSTAATRGARPARRSCASCASPVRTRRGRCADGTETIHDAPRKEGEMRTSDALVDALCAAAVSVPTDRDVRQADAS